MLSLIKIEWLKIKKYPAFWWMLGIVALTYPSINLMFLKVYEDITKGKDTGAIAKMLLGNPYAFPETWHTVAFFSSFFIILPAILVIMLVTNEYNYRTHRQNIIDGWSRKDFITSKLCDVLIVTSIITLSYAIVAIGYGSYTDSKNFYRWSEQLQYIPLFFLQTFAQLSIAFLLGYLIKKAFIALGVFLFYYLILENIAVSWFKYQVKNDIGKFFPIEASDRLIPVPAFIGNFGQDMKAGYQRALDAIPMHIGLTIVITAIIWVICYRVHSKRDL